MDRGAWWATVRRVAKSRTRLKGLSTHAQTHTHLHTQCHSSSLNVSFSQSCFSTSLSQVLYHPQQNFLIPRRKKRVLIKHLMFSGKYIECLVVISECDVNSAEQVLLSSFYR